MLITKTQPDNTFLSVLVKQMLLQMCLFIINSPNFSAFAGSGVNLPFHLSSKFLKLKPLSEK